MNAPRGGRRSRIPRGVGLTEVMIAMGVGLVILVALAYFFVGSREVNRTTDDMSRIQESGRNAIEIMGRAIRQAGARADPNVLFSGKAIDWVPGEPKQITVRYDAQQGGEMDCLRTANTATPGGSLMTFKFRVVNGDPPELQCNDAVVVDNVEDMQFMFGIDSTKDGNIEFYTAAPTTEQLGQVAAVRVALTVRGPTANAAAGGGYLRRTFNATFTVRNQAW